MYPNTTSKMGWKHAGLTMVLVIALSHGLMMALITVYAYFDSPERSALADLLMFIAIYPTPSAALCIGAAVTVMRRRRVFWEPVEQATALSTTVTAMVLGGWAVMMLWQALPLLEQIWPVEDNLLLLGVAFK